MMGDYWNRAHGMRWNLGAMGDDSGTMLSLGFNGLQIQQITSAHQSGALSDAGYQAIVSGFISPDELVDFLAADPGAAPTPTQVQRPSTVIGPSTVPTAQLAPGAAPRVTYTQPLSTFFTGSTLIAGIPNMVVLGFGLLAIPLLLGGRGRR